MAYDVKAIMEKLAKMTEKKDSLTWAKFGPGNYNLRILPVKTLDNQPVVELSFYRDEDLVGRYKVPTAAQFGLDDPIYEAVTELAKDKSKESWELRKHMSPWTSWFLPVLVRGQEDKGVQIWELKKEVVLQFMTHVTSEDYRDTDLLDPMTGHDWTLTVTESDKKFKGYSVKNFMLTPRPKPSKAAPTKEACDKLLSQVPDLVSYFKGRALTPEQAAEKLQGFMERYNNHPMDGESGTDTGGNVSRNGEGGDSTTSAVLSDIEKGFADL